MISYQSLLLSTIVLNDTYVPQYNNILLCTMYIVALMLWHLAVSYVCTYVRMYLHIYVHT